ncbi:MAG TPA: radical SAM protein [Firmicutes bacterium]|nr:radical SAM protein [Bacillota bacterium]
MKVKIIDMKIKTIQCKSALTKSGIGGVDYVINPYVGCAHACVYCYADFMRRFTGHENDTWGAFVDVKANIVERLRRELLPGAGRKSRKSAGSPTGSPAGPPASTLHLPGLFQPDIRYRGEIMLSSVTDPYQPLEARWRLTRSCLEVLREAGLEAERSIISILTKSELVTRDIDILKEFQECRVGLTITTDRDDVAKSFEPGASPPSRRLAALEILNKEGIKTWAFMGPVLPFFSDKFDEMERLFGAVAATGTREILVDSMNFYPSVKHRVGRLFSRLDESGKYPGAASYLRKVFQDLEGWKIDIKNKASEAGAKCGLRVRFAF